MTAMTSLERIAVEIIEASRSRAAFWHGKEALTLSEFPLWRHYSFLSMQETAPSNFNSNILLHLLILSHNNMPFLDLSNDPICQFHLLSPRFCVAIIFVGKTRL